MRRQEMMTKKQLAFCFLGRGQYCSPMVSQICDTRSTKKGSLTESESTSKSRIRPVRRRVEVSDCMD